MAALMALVLAQLAASQPAISFPFNSQLPPAARTDKFFSFSLSPSTFTSDSKRMTYALGRHPDWLSLGTDGLRLYGTPKDASVPPGHVVGQPVEIIATDDQGPTTMKATVVVSRDPPPAIRIPISKQIGGFGKFSAPSSVLSYPDTDFKFTFNRDTFAGKSSNHYATSGDGSPLPAWVAFDNGSMTFSGRTPPFKSLVQPPQAFDFRLVASDIVGFAASSINFAIVVGSHNLTTDHPMISLNASWGSKLLYDGFEHGIRLDGKPVAPSELTVTTTSLPPWLTLDTATGNLYGTPGPGDHSTSFTVTFQDPFADTLNVLVAVHVASSLFESTVEDMEARPDSRIDVDLAKYFRHPADIQVEVTAIPKQDWLKVHGLRIFGQVPKSAKGDFQISIRAKSKKSGIQETEQFGVGILALDGSTTVPIAPNGPSTPTGTHHPTDTSRPQPTASPVEPEPNRLSTGEIMLATIIPIIFVCVLLMLLVCYVRRRRARGGKSRDNMSNPMAIGHDVTDSDSTDDAQGMVRDARAEKLQHYKLSKAGRGTFKRPLTRRRSSDTLGPGDGSDSGYSRGMHTYEGRPSASVSSTACDDQDRRSWITVEGDDVASIAPSGSSAASHIRSSGGAADAAQHLQAAGPVAYQGKPGGTFDSDVELGRTAVDARSQLGHADEERAVHVQLGDDSGERRGRQRVRTPEAGQGAGGRRRQGAVVQPSPVAEHWQDRRRGDGRLVFVDGELASDWASTWSEHVVQQPRPRWTPADREDDDDDDDDGERQLQGVYVRAGCGYGEDHQMIPERRRISQPCVHIIYDDEYRVHGLGEDL
ncbi:hypothetical protein XA68_17661 [Ophiocordyceps unilateralis]|uniref:Dystroglycan-type cadherin-like domain-containing protein n=1 Tax=Ophiocordyceps unilateralis TaxID=268505 RepID=A0A2A9P349_OPHUN|nr:hypothetical protein XA68_17661 [Ophiocordyceps unilateralis]